jgi:hypothetical protein
LESGLFRFLQALLIEWNVEPGAQTFFFAVTVEGSVTVPNQNELTHRLDSY